MHRLRRPGQLRHDFQSGAEHGYLLLSAIVPTAIAQHRFSPDVEAERAAGRQRQQAAHAAEPRPATQLIAAGERA